MTVNFDVGYFCNVIEHSVGVVVCTTKCDVFHEDLVKSLRKGEKNNYVD